MEFLETKALITALDDDYEEMWAIVAQLLPTEQWRLRAACYRLIRSIDGMPRAVNAHKEE